MINEKTELVLLEYVLEVLLQPVRLEFEICSLRHLIELVWLCPHAL